MNTQIYGFGLLRNGVKYDYPFAESLRSLAPVVNDITLALGKSDDGTEAKVQSLGLQIKTIPTVWDESMRQSGLILSQQTNVALEQLRREHPEDGAWGFYLQADEVLHEDDYDLLRDDFRKAQEQGCDCIRFRWLHFWRSYERVAIDWFWYPQEIRGVKLQSKIESYGDAQSFRNFTKPYESDARIFHYGYIREEEAFKLKVEDFRYWWHSTEKSLAKSKKKFEKRDRNMKKLRYLGPHPQVMAERAGGFAYPRLPEIGLVGQPDSFSREWRAKINADKIHWGDSLSKLKGNYPKAVLEESGWRKWLNWHKIPEKNFSPLARPWTKEMRATFQLSDQGITVGQGPRPQDPSTF